MESPYQYTLPSGSKLFRAVTVAKSGRWYSLSLEDSYTYGQKITEYSTTKELKLLNITSLSFHTDFIDRLNIMYPGIDNTGFDIDKIKCFIPLGLVDLQSQVLSLSLLNCQMPINTMNWDIKCELTSMNLLNRHRLSDHALDTHLVSILEKIYGNYYDGYISPIKWPTKLHGGFFPRELCLFKVPNDVKEEKEHIRPQTAGSLTNPSQKFIKPLTIDEAYFRNLEHGFLTSEKQYVFKPLWNPHTQDTNTRMTQLSFQSSKQRWRKHVKINN